MTKLKIKPFSQASQQKKILLALIALAALNLLLYINTLHYDFLKDDYRLIVENPRVKDFQSFRESIGSKFFAFPDFPYLHYWRPLSLFSFYLDYQVWGLNPSGYHLFNILINTGNALLVFLIFYLLFKKIHYAFIGALGFSIHPSHVEAVSWISGRTDLLSAFFIFAAILFFILFLEKNKVYFYALTAFFFLLALLSKENGVLFPLLAVGLMFITQPTAGSSGPPGTPAPPGTPGTTVTPGKLRLSGGSIKKLLVTLPFWIIGIIYFIIHNRYSGVGEVAANFSFKDTFVILKTIGAYTKVILTPFFPTPHFSMHLFDRSHLEFLLYFALAIGILVFIVIKRKEYKYSLYTLLFFIFLLPVLDPEIVPSYPKIVIRFAYIPAVFAGIFAADTYHFFKNHRLRNYYTGLLVVIALIWGIESYLFQVYYKDSANHYNRLIRYYPEDCSLLLPSALITAQEGDYARALALVDQALAVNDQDPWLDISEMGGLLKANLLVIAGDPEEGKTLAEKILGETRKDEMKYFGHLVLSKYYEKKGDLTMALDLLKKAEKIGTTADLFFRLAVLYGKMNNYPQALYYVEKAIALNPTMKKYAEFRVFILNLE